MMEICALALNGTNDNSSPHEKITNKDKCKENGNFEHNKFNIKIFVDARTLSSTTPFFIKLISTKFNLPYYLSL